MLVTTVPRGSQQAKSGRRSVQDMASRRGTVGTRRGTPSPLAERRRGRGQGVASQSLTGASRPFGPPSGRLGWHPSALARVGRGDEPGVGGHLDERRRRTPSAAEVIYRPLYQALMAWEPVVGQRRQDGHLLCCARGHLDHVGRLAPILRPSRVAEGRKMAGREGESSVVVIVSAYARGYRRLSMAASRRARSAGKLSTPLSSRSPSLKAPRMSARSFSAA